MRPLVSILIPAYNAEQWIRESIGSALQQTWPRKEIIVVDDGSTDNTRRVMRFCADAAVKTVTQPNCGASAARNRALSLAQGDFIQWLDADDVLAGDKIENQLANSDNFQDSGTLHSSAWGSFYRLPRKATFRRSSLWQDLSPKQWLLTYFEGECMMHPAAWLVSRAVTDRAGPWDERLTLNDDGEYFCRIVAASDRVRFCAQARSYYRTGDPGSLSWGLSSTRSDKAIRSLALSVDLCGQTLLALENSEVSRRACMRLYQRFIADIYPDGSDSIEWAQQRIRELGGEPYRPKQSWKFGVLRAVLGWQRARMVRRQLWRLEVALRRQVEALALRETGSERGSGSAS
jgi:glycosyltransferase involved in cell wall biosynthesis